MIASVVHSRGIAGVLVACLVISANAQELKWSDVMRQPAAWYASEAAIEVGDNVLLWQRDVGGWNKISNMAVMTERHRADALAQKANGVCTLDNGATHQQIRYLARLYSATQIERFRAGFDRGLAYVLEAQYDNGGWPQYYPLRGGYHDHVTFNDGGMVGSMNILRDVAAGAEDFHFTTPEQRAASQAALDRAIQCILDAQIVVDGRRTGWCAQHHHETLAPARGRSYELPSISGSDTVSIVRFLMSIEDPSPQVVDAVESAVEWLRSAAIHGKRHQKIDGDRILVDDDSAPPLWARFYEVETSRPIFCNRDGIVRYEYSAIDRGRRTSYLWLGNWGQSLLEKDYPAWQARRATAGVR